MTYLNLILMQHLLQVTKKNVFIAFVASLFIVLLIVLVYDPHKKRGDDLLPVNLTAIRTPYGWGYKIFVDNKIFITQETIPAIEGNHPFKSKEAALAVGKLTVKKLVSGKIPSITPEELDSLKVLE